MSSIDFSQSLKSILIQIFKKLTNYSKPEGEYEFQELKTVMVSSDINKTLIAQSLLKEAEIDYYVKDEHLQNTIGFGFNHITGPINIRVPEDKFEEVREILKELIENDYFEKSKE